MKYKYFLLLIFLALLIIPQSSYAAQCYGAGTKCGENWIGGYTNADVSQPLSYNFHYPSSGSNVHVVSGQTAAALASALSAAESGDIVWVPGDYEITIPENSDLSLKSGVILASDRGLNGHPGAKIKWLYVGSCPSGSWFKPMIKAQSKSKISGLRLQGSSGSSGCASAIKINNANSVEIENCEISDFAGGGVYFNGSPSPSISPWSGNQRNWVHHCYIHDVTRKGLGYGVGQQGNGNSYLAEGNIFKNNRHSVMNSGGSESYEIRYNIFYNGIGSQIDSHGGGYHGFSAGNHLYIHHNTISKNGPDNIGIRGIVTNGAVVEFNWTKKTTSNCTGGGPCNETNSNGFSRMACEEGCRCDCKPGDCKNSVDPDCVGQGCPYPSCELKWAKMTVVNNWYGDTAPSESEDCPESVLPDIPDDPTPPTPPTPPEDPVTPSEMKYTIDLTNRTDVGNERPIKLPLMLDWDDTAPAYKLTITNNSGARGNLDECIQRPSEKKLENCFLASNTEYNWSLRGCKEGCDICEDPLTGSFKTSAAPELLLPLDPVTDSDGDDWAGPKYTHMSATEYTLQRLWDLFGDLKNILGLLLGYPGFLMQEWLFDDDTPASIMPVNLLWCPVENTDTYIVRVYRADNSNFVGLEEVEQSPVMIKNESFYAKDEYIIQLLNKLGEEEVKDLINIYQDEDGKKRDDGEQGLIARLGEEEAKRTIKALERESAKELTRLIAAGISLDEKNVFEVVKDGDKIVKITLLKKPAYEDRPELVSNYIFEKDQHFAWQVASCDEECSKKCQEYKTDEEIKECLKGLPYSQVWRVVPSTYTNTLDKPKLELFYPPNDPEGDNAIGLPVTFLSTSTPLWALSFNIEIYKEGTTESILRLNTESNQYITLNDWADQLRNKDWDLELDTVYTWKVTPCWDINGELCVDRNDPNWPTNLIDILKILARKDHDYWVGPWKFRTTGATPENRAVKLDADGNASWPISISWAAVSGAGSYYFEIATDEAFTNIVIPENERVVYSSEINSGYPYLLMGDTYYWRVKTCADKAGLHCGDISPMETFTTSILKPPSDLFPGKSDLASPGEVFWNNVVLDWNKIEGAKSYWYNLSSAELSLAEEEKTANDEQLIQIDPVDGVGKVYSWKAKSCISGTEKRDDLEDPKICSSWSKTMHFKTMEPQTDSKKGLIPCGRDIDDPDTPYNERKRCSLGDMFLMIKIILDFVLWKVIPIILALELLATGVIFFLGGRMGSMETIEKVRLLWKATGAGLAIAFFAWTIINVFLGFIGYKFAVFGNWWQINF